MLAILNKGARPLSFAYPVLVWLGKDSPTLLLVLAGLLLAAMLLDLSSRWPRPLFYGGLALTAVAAVVVGVYDRHNLVRLYPFLISLSVLNLFISAKTPEDNPMLGPMRRWLARDRDLLLLLHRAKGFWVWGLALNSTVLGVLVFACDLKTWALYASFYSYLYLLALFACTIAFVAWHRRRLF